MNINNYNDVRTAAAALSRVAASIRNGADVDRYDLAEVERAYNAASTMYRVAIRAYRETVRACLSPDDPHTFAECKKCPNLGPAPDASGYCCALSGRSLEVPLS